MQSTHASLVSRNAVIAGGLLIAVTIVAVGAAQIAKRVSPPVASAAQTAAAIVEIRDIRFIEANRVAVSAMDARTGQKILDLVDSDGFVRVVLSALAFDRERLGVTIDPAFRLTRWSDSRLTIEDLSTGLSINLGAFGPANKNVFYRFLPSEAKTS